MTIRNIVVSTPYGEGVEGTVAEITHFSINFSPYSQVGYIKVRWSVWTTLADAISSATPLQQREATLEGHVPTLLASIGGDFEALRSDLYDWIIGFDSEYAAGTKHYEIIPV